MKMYPVLNKAPNHEYRWRNGGIAQHILNFGSS